MSAPIILTVGLMSPFQVWVSCSSKTRRVGEKSSANPNFERRILVAAQLQDYSDMVDNLGEGDFSADQSATLVRMLEEMVPAQNIQFDPLLEELEHFRRENRREHEKTRAQFKMLDTELDTKFEAWCEKLDRHCRWTIALFTAYSVSVISLPVYFGSVLP